MRVCICVRERQRQNAERERETHHVYIPTAVINAACDQLIIIKSLTMIHTRV